VTEFDARVLAEIRRIARTELEFDGDISPATRLDEDLSLDSLALIVVAVGLENAFRVKLREEDVGTIATVADLVRLVALRVGESAAPESA
jgi:acyl carrier protein